MFNVNDYLSKVQFYFEFCDFADKTKQNYNSSITLYLKWLNNNNIMPEEASFNDIRTFLTLYKAKRNWSNRTFNFYISKIRFFQIFVLHKTWNPYEIPFAKFSTKLPKILSKDEVRFFISSLDDIKIKAICSLMYGSGLRVSEVRNLQYKDVSRSNMTIYIGNTKSRNDRYVILSENSLNILSKYWVTHNKPKGLLFPQKFNSNKPIDTQTINRHLEKHCNKLKWDFKIYPHLFRHCFGSHMYENGADLLVIQKLLGHKSINSTTIYVQLSNPSNLGISSPMDWR